MEGLYHGDALADGVYCVLDVLNDRHILHGKKVVVVGGGDVGCEVAMHLDYQGKEIVLLEMKDDILTEQCSLNANLMLRKIIREANVDVRVQTRLVQLEGKTALVEHGGIRERIPFDSLVLAVGFRTDTSLEQQLLGKVDVTTIGDAAKPGHVFDAVRGGFGAACIL